MKNKSRKIWLISILVVLLITVGAIGVLAQEGDDTDADTPSTSPHGPWCGDRQSDLAEALGITVEELEAAQREAQAARIARAVEEGYLTQDQGNLMLAMNALKGSFAHHEMLASALGISVEELDEAIEEGTLRELLDDITPAELQEGLEEAFEDILEQAVDDLLITEEQADLVRDHVGDNFGLYWHGFGGHGGFGHGGYGRGGYHGRMGSGGFPGVRYPNAPFAFNNA